MKIQLNGTATESSDNIPLLEFLDQANFNPKLIAIEYNGEILHRQHWPTQTLSDGDRLEIVTIVGGG